MRVPGRETGSRDRFVHPHAESFRHCRRALKMPAFPIRPSTPWCVRLLEEYVAYEGTTADRRLD